MSDPNEPTSEDLQAMRASMDRLAEAGLIEILEYDAVSDRGIFSFHPAYHRLLMAGRNPLLEVGLAGPLAVGDLAAARAWIEHEDAIMAGREARTDDRGNAGG